MRLSYSSLRKKSRVFRQLTGLSLETFEGLMKKNSDMLKRAFPRLGRKPKVLTVEDKVILLLVYYRCYVTHEFLGYFVQLHDSNVSRLFKRLEPIIAQQVSIKKDRSLTESQVKYLLIDATEQPIQRPKYRQARKDYYSGKKKHHTQKVEIVVTDRGKIVNISKSRPGSEHDFCLRRKSDPLSPHCPKYADRAYQGWDKFSPQVYIPRKKPPKGKLTSEEKQYNLKQSKIRIPVEHKIAQLKRFRILKDTYRNFRRKHHLRFNIIAGIVNFQCGF